MRAGRTAAVVHMVVVVRVVVIVAMVVRVVVRVVVSGAMPMGVGMRVPGHLAIHLDFAFATSANVTHAASSFDLDFFHAHLGALGHL